MLGEVLNEQQVLKCLLSAPDKVYQFDRPYFQSDEGRALFHSIKSLYDDKVELTKTNVLAHASRKSKSVTEDVVDRIFEVEASIESFDYYFSILRKAFAKDKISNKLLKETLVEVSSKGDDLNTDYIRSLVTDIEDNLRLIDGKKSYLLTMDNMFTTYVDALHRRARGEYKFSYGDSHLDKSLTVGPAPGQITTLFAATGMGKSTYALSLVNKMINKQMPCVYISLEMDTISTMDRLIAMRRKIPVDMLYPRNQDDGLLVPDEVFQIVNEERQRLSNIDKFYFVEESQLSLTDIETIVQEAAKRFRTDYFIVYIDLFTMLKEFSGEDARGYEDGINRQHYIAQRNNVHFFNVVQANRSADSARVASIDSISNLRPSLNTIKNSHAIAERSRVVISAFRKKYYAERLFPEATDELRVMDDLLEIQLLKQSQGKVGHMVKYLFDGPKFTLTPYVEVFDEDFVTNNSDEEE